MSSYLGRSLLCAIGLSTPLAASALDLRVTTFADQDDGQCSAAHCSLREAISAANAHPGETRIQLAAGQYPIEKANPDPGDEWPVDENANRVGDFDVHGRVLLSGRGVADTWLNARSLDRLFHVHAGARLEVRHLTLANGMQIHNGGALRNDGHVVLHQVQLRDNQVVVYLDQPTAPQVGNGGAIANYGVLSVQRSEFRRNYANGEMGNDVGYGGALYNEGALTVRDSLFTSNRASDYGEWGIGGALYNQGSADIARTSFQGNQVSWSGYGSAIANAGQLRLANSTLSGNRTTEQGTFENGHPWRTGLNATARAELIHVTIAGNEGWGLTNLANLLLRNSIVAGNYSNEFGVVRNCHNKPGALGFQARGLLLGTDAGNCMADRHITDASTFTHHLFPLEWNNGSHPLRRTSAAIDAGVGNCASHDQRGLNRPRDGNGDGIANCDLGAFERAYP